MPRRRVVVSLAVFIGVALPQCHGGPAGSKANGPPTVAMHTRGGRLKNRTVNDDREDTPPSLDQCLEGNGSCVKPSLFLPSSSAADGANDRYLETLTRSENVCFSGGTSKRSVTTRGEFQRGGMKQACVNRSGVPPAEALSRYPTLETPGGLVRALDYVGTISFAMSGAATAGMRGMNLLGVLTVGTLTATGGGTTRDLLLGQTPVFWLQENEYLGICVATALSTFISWPIVSRIKFLSSMGTGMDGWLSQAVDTIGLASFCVAGTQHGIRRGLHPLTTVVIACITCSGGGIMRDILTSSPVLVLSAHAQIYVTTTAIGSAAYLLARRLSSDPLIRISTGFFCVVILRVIAFIYNIRLPTMVQRR